MYVCDTQHCDLGHHFLKKQLYVFLFNCGISCDPGHLVKIMTIIQQKLCDPRHKGTIKGTVRVDLFTFSKLCN